MKTSELRAAIFHDGSGALEDEFVAWAACARFRAFAERYREKLRKKLRSQRDEEGLRDVRLEWEVAYRLLQDRRFAVEYEKQATAGQRNPDFTVTFRTHTLLHLEVKRVRTAGPEPAAKCADVLCDAICQLMPNALNVLVIGFTHDALAGLDLAKTLRRLRERAERKDEVYFQRRGFADARDFLRRYRRLSAVVVLSDDEAALVANSLADRPLPGELWRAVASTLAAV